MVQLLTLPFRVFFGVVFAILWIPIKLLLLPFLLLKLLVRGLVTLAVLPFVILAAVCGLIVGLLALPLLPVLVVAVCVWALMRRSPAATVIRG